MHCGVAVLERLELVAGVEVARWEWASVWRQVGQGRRCRVGVEHEEDPVGPLVVGLGGNAA